MAAEVRWRADTGPFSLLRRVGSTLLMARSIHRSVKRLERDQEDESDEDEDEWRERWEQLHRQNAQATYRHIVQYKGFLAKAGQGISARDGGIPQPWRDEMKALQDHLPVSGKEEIQKTVRAELGKKVEDVFDDFGYKPLASATVGQAHQAVLKATGQKVCVKVQHKGVARMMAVDLRCIEYIAKVAIRKHKTAPDVTPIIREWRRASADEVDFLLEARSMSRAGKALQRHGVDVKCPVPVEGSCSRRVLTMEFIEGFKITDTERFPPNTDMTYVARQLLEAFATLIFQEGLIHGDPHPGNIFVELRGEKVRPVLLDWGITKELTKEECYHTARWVIASMSQDRTMFLSAGRALGYTLTEHFETEALEDWMTGCLFMFRDTLPASAQAYLFEMLDDRSRSEEKEEKQKKEAAEHEAKEKAASNPKKKRRSAWVYSSAKDTVTCTKSKKKRNSPRR